MPLGSRSSASRYSGKVSQVQSMPAAMASAEMSSARSRLRTTRWRSVGAGRRQREPAVAHDHGGHAVPARAGAQRVPEHLGVHVGVAVDEAGGDDVALGVDLVGAPLPDAADGGDAPVAHAHIGPVAALPRCRRPRCRCGSPGRRPRLTPPGSLARRAVPPCRRSAVILRRAERPRGCPGVGTRCEDRAEASRGRPLRAGGRPRRTRSRPGGRSARRRRCRRCGRSDRRRSAA